MVVSSNDSPVSRQRETCERLSSTWPYSISLANATRVFHTYTDIYYVHARLRCVCVCVVSNRGSGEPQKKTRWTRREDEKVLSGVHDAHTGPTKPICD